MRLEAGHELRLRRIVNHFPAAHRALASELAGVGLAIPNADVSGNVRSLRNRDAERGAILNEPEQNERVEKRYRRRSANR